MLRNLIGKRVRVKNEHAKQHGQDGAIIGIQQNSDEVEINESSWRGEAVEVGPDAELVWDEADDAQDEPAANEGLRSIIVCFGNETAMEYQELEILDRRAP